MTQAVVSVYGFSMSEYWIQLWCVFFVLILLEPSNVISMLISSDFLKMDTLVSKQIVVPIYKHLLSHRYVAFVVIVCT